MKRLIQVSIFLLFTSCASNELKFDHKKHCSAEALKYVENELATHELAKKKRRGVITKKEQLKLNSYEMLARAFDEILRPQVFECIAEYERLGNRGTYAICTVTAIDKKGKVSFLSVDDTYTKLNEGLRSCITKTLRSFDFSKYPDIVITQPINVNP